MLCRLILIWCYAFDPPVCTSDDILELCVQIQKPQSIPEKEKKKNIYYTLENKIKKEKSPVNRESYELLHRIFIVYSISVCCNLEKRMIYKISLVVYLKLNDFKSLTVLQ